MSKQSWLIFFLLLVIVLGGVMWYYNIDILNFKNLTKEKNSVLTKAIDEKTITLPIALSNQSVSATKIHYFIYGTIAEIKTTAEGSEIFLLNAKNMPPLIIESGTRISKITLPYKSNPAVPLTTKDLKPGLVIDLSIEYDVVTQTWSILDVYVPTDRNK